MQSLRRLLDCLAQRSVLVARGVERTLTWRRLFVWFARVCCVVMAISVWLSILVKGGQSALLPLLVRQYSAPHNSDSSLTSPLPGYEKVTALQSTTTDVQRIFNLQFASQREWNKAAVEKMVRKYQIWSGDTGSMPVQIAVISVRIQYLTEHMRNNRKDKSCLRTLLKLVHQRRKYLRYLARTDAHTFTTLLKDLNLKEPTTVKYKTKK